MYCIICNKCYFVVNSLIGNLFDVLVCLEILFLGIYKYCLYEEGFLKVICGICIDFV